MKFKHEIYHFYSLGKYECRAEINQTVLVSTSVVIDLHRKFTFHFIFFLYFIAIFHYYILLSVIYSWCTLYQVYTYQRTSFVSLFLINFLNFSFFSELFSLIFQQISTLHLPILTCSFYYL